MHDDDVHAGHLRDVPAVFIRKSSDIRIGQRFQADIHKRASIVKHQANRGKRKPLREVGSFQSFTRRQRSATVDFATGGDFNRSFELGSNSNSSKIRIRSLELGSKIEFERSTQYKLFSTQCMLGGKPGWQMHEALSIVMPVLAEKLAAGGRYDHLSRLATTCKALNHSVSQQVFDEWTLSREAVAREADDKVAIDLTSGGVDQSEIDQEAVCGLHTGSASAKAVAQLQHLEELSGRLRGHLKSTLQHSSSLRRLHVNGEQDSFRENDERRLVEKIQSAGLQELRMEIGKVANVELDCPDLELLQIDVRHSHALLGHIPLVAMAANIIRGLKRHSPKIRLLEFCLDEKSPYVDFTTSAKCIEELHRNFPSQVSTRRMEVGEYEAYKEHMGRAHTPCNEAENQTIISISPKDVSFDSISKLRLSEFGNDGDEFF
eukprot:gene14935-20990_t